MCSSRAEPPDFLTTNRTEVSWYHESNFTQFHDGFAASMNSPILLHAWIRSQTREFRRIVRCQNLSDKSATCLGKWTWRIAVNILWSSVSSTTSSFVPRRRAHNVGTWFFLLAPRPSRRPHTARNVSEAEFGQLDKLAGMRSDPTRFSSQRRF